MITILMTVTCAYCPATETETIEYRKTGPFVSNFIKKLRALGWELHYDEGWKLALTVCPSCHKKK